MKLSLIAAFIVFVISLIISVVVGLQMIWQDPRQPTASESSQILATSIVIMLAALFYIPVGEAMNRILSTGSKSSSDEKR